MAIESENRVIVAIHLERTISHISDIDKLYQVLKTINASLSEHDYKIINVDVLSPSDYHADIYED